VGVIVDPLSSGPSPSRTWLSVNRKKRGATLIASITGQRSVLACVAVAGGEERERVQRSTLFPNQIIEKGEHGLPNIDFIFIYIYFLIYFFSRERKAEKKISKNPRDHRG
jgi:hypothetical protein